MLAMEQIVIEEVDVTATEEHEYLKELIAVGLRWRLVARALVIGDIFVALGRRQVSPDILVRYGAVPGQRSRYLVEDEGAPDVTIEILSTVNHSSEGMVLLQQKRDLFGEMGVAEHIEIDPNHLHIQVWASERGLFRSVAIGKTWHSERLGVTFRFVADQFEAVDDQGRVFEVPEAGFSRAEAQTIPVEEATARAEAESARAEAESARADRLLRLLEAHGIDPGDEA